jgi:hypothetical protein
MWLPMFRRKSLPPLSGRRHFWIWPNFDGVWEINIISIYNWHELTILNKQNVFSMTETSDGNFHRIRLQMMCDELQNNSVLSKLLHACRPSYSMRRASKHVTLKSIVPAINRTALTINITINVTSQCLKDRRLHYTEKSKIWGNAAVFVRSV